MSRIFQLPRQVPLVSGAVSPGAKANFFLTTTTTPTNTFTDAALTTPHANPVIANAAGEFATIYLDPDVVYKLTLDDTNDALIYTEDPIQDALTQANIGFIFYPRSAAEISAGITPTDFSFPEGNLLRYGAVGDGVANDTQAIQDWIDVGGSDGALLFAPAGSYLHSSISIANPVQIRGAGGINPGATSFDYSGTTGDAWTFSEGADSDSITECRFHAVNGGTSNCLQIGGSDDTKSQREFRITRCEFENFFVSIDIFNGINCVYDQVRILGRGKAIAGGIGIRQDLTSFSTFINVYFQIVETGVQLLDGSPNTFIDCAWDPVKTGVDIGSQATVRAVFINPRWDLFDQAAGDRCIVEANSSTIQIYGGVVRDENSAIVENPIDYFTRSAGGRTRLKMVIGTREYPMSGSLVVTGDFSLSAAWGSTASVPSVNGRNQRFHFRVNCSGSGIAANPTVTYTPNNGSWIDAPTAIVIRNGGNQPTVAMSWVTTADDIVITFLGTPLTGQSFEFEVIVSI